MTNNERLAQECDSMAKEAYMDGHESEANRLVNMASYYRQKEEWSVKK